MERIASVWVPGLRRAGGPGAADREAEEPGADALAATRGLAASLLAGSPRVMVVEAGLCRVDAGGRERRGGEAALARTLRRAVRDGAPGAGAARGSGETAPGAGTAEAGIGVGIADVAVAADAAARLAVSGDEGAKCAAGPEALRGRAGRGFHIVPAGESRAFLAPLPLAFLPLPGDLREVFRLLGVRTIAEIAARERSEMEARFGSAGVRAHRRSRGEETRLFRPLAPESPPEARLELEGSIGSLEPLLFVLRHLLGRIHDDLAGEGWCARSLLLRVLLEGGECREVRIAPAHPTRSERLLFDLCRTGLERSMRERKLEARALALELRVVERAPAPARQGDLFAAGSRDPTAAMAALARIRARLGDEAVVRPAPRAEHRPEARNAWRPSPLESSPAPAANPEAAIDPPLASVLRLLPRPLAVRVRCEDGRPAVLEDASGRRDLLAAEGPERLSGEWWRKPYRREYFRVLTSSGEMLWLFRDHGAAGRGRWHLHGWWD